jgi:mono/diheme cytochrome c family protein
MNVRLRWIVWSISALGIIGLLIAPFVMKGPERVVDVRLPAELSSHARTGERSFQVHCQACHGLSGRGSETGSPLVHRIYAPDHHSDTVFTLAVQNGVRGHHWGTRNMPPQPELDVPTIENIIAFIREVQRANGIN